MKSAGAMLLDISASKTSGSNLQKILETAFTVTVPPQLPRHALHSGGVLEEELTQTIRRADAGLIFLISPQTALDESRRVLSALKKIVPEIPVIVALEQCAPQQAFEFLNAGAADFVTAPFQDIDVLPRAWKALKNFLGEDIPGQEDSRQQQ